MNKRLTIERVKNIVNDYKLLPETVENIITTFERQLIQESCGKKPKGRYRFFLYNVDYIDHNTVIDAMKELGFNYMGGDIIDNKNMLILSNCDED